MASIMDFSHLVIILIVINTICKMKIFAYVFTIGMRDENDDEYVQGATALILLKS